jgi:hypothetical protein
MMVYAEVQCSQRLIGYRSLTVTIDEKDCEIEERASFEPGSGLQAIHEYIVESKVKV